MNYQKQKTYAEMNIRLAIALRHGFFLEAVFLEYAMLQDRLESIIRHAKGPEAVKPRQTINKTINVIRDTRPFTDIRVRRMVPVTLLDEASSWKDERNSFVHALANTGIEQERLEDLAQRGKELVKKVDAASKRINRKFDSQEH